MEPARNPFSKEATLYPVTELCPCGCGTEGAVKKKPMKDGLFHVRGCPCKRCEGQRSKRGAWARETRVAKAVHGKRNFGSGAFGGVDTTGGVCDVEETSNQAIVRGFKRWWESKGVTTKLEPLMRRSVKPRALVLYWDKRHRVAILPYEPDFKALCDAASGLCPHCGRSV